MPFVAHAQFAEAILSPLSEAARIILDLREQGIVVDRKSDDSPVTEADRRAEAILTSAIAQILPGVPIVGEESSAAGSAPAVRETFVLLDPLDGTRDYCAGNDDFTVNIGLIDAGRPAFGLIYAPARRELYLTPAHGEAAATMYDCASPREFSKLELQRIHVRTGHAGRLSALVSRRESGPEFDDRFERLGVIERTPMSSAVKFGRLARGDADIYARFGPTCEWDTAAGQAILEAAGGTVTALDGSPLRYGKAAAKFINGPFIARGMIPSFAS